MCFSFAASSTSTDNYFALDRIAFYSVRRLPCTHLGPQSRNSSTAQLMVVHNQCFSLSVGEGALTASEGTVVSPPSYAEAVAIGVRNDGFAAVPQEVREKGFSDSVIVMMGQSSVRAND